MNDVGQFFWSFSYLWAEALADGAVIGSHNFRYRTLRQNSNHHISPDLPHSLLLRLAHHERLCPRLAASKVLYLNIPRPMPVQEYLAQLLQLRQVRQFGML